MSSKRDLYFKLATGQRKFEHAKLSTPIRLAMITNGLMMRIKEIPAEVILDNSYRSAYPPINITELNNTAIGKAIGKNDSRR